MFNRRGLTAEAFERLSQRMSQKRSQGVQTYEGLQHLPPLDETLVMSGFTTDPKVSYRGVLQRDAETQAPRGRSQSVQTDEDRQHFPPLEPNFQLMSEFTTDPYKSRGVYHRDAETQAPHILHIDELDFDVEGPTPQDLVLFPRCTFTEWREATPWYILFYMYNVSPKILSEETIQLLIDEYGEQTMAAQEHKNVAQIYDQIYAYVEACVSEAENFIDVEDPILNQQFPNVLGYQAGTRPLVVPPWTFDVSERVNTARQHLFNILTETESNYRKCAVLIKFLSVMNQLTGQEGIQRLGVERFMAMTDLCNDLLEYSYAAIFLLTILMVDVSELDYYRMSRVTPFVG